MNEKFSKEMEIMKNNQLKMYQIKASINQIKTTIDSIISRQDQLEERIPEMEDKSKGILHKDNRKERDEYNIQGL
jgi:prefoldin subunit 5